MRRRETVLIGLAFTSVAFIAVSCALNAGGIVYIVADSGPPSDATQTLSDGAIIESDGAVLQPDGAVVTGKCAADQVDIDAGFCIDKNEVTNGQYLAFLIATGADGGLTGACGADSVYQGPGAEVLSHPSYPTHGMDWCAAKAYCQWAGKRLCGTIADGGEVDFQNASNYDDASVSEWYFACTRNGGQIYPYGNTYDGGACNDSDYKEGGVIPPGTATGCVGGYSEINDMVGNVWEWDNSCTDDTNSSAQCHVRGGSYMSNMGQARCDSTFGSNRNASSTDFGIRCCADEKK